MKKFVLLALAASGLALPSSSHVVHEKRGLHTAPAWEKREPVDGATVVPVRIALKQTNLDKGMDLILDVSQPGSPKYGKHYKADEVAALFAPAQKTIDAVKGWLVKAGVPANKIYLSKSKAWLSFATTVDKLQQLVKADYHVYENLRSRDEHVGTEQYKLPADVAPFVDFILPGTTFIKHPKRAKKASVAAVKEPLRPLSQDQIRKLQSGINGTANCAQYVTPQCIKAMYNIPDGTLSNNTNPMGIFESLEDIYSQEDLDAFYRLFAPNIPKGTGPQLDLINGAVAPTSQDQAGGESDLDFQMAIPIIYPQTTTLFQVRSDNDIFLALLGAIDDDFCQNNPDLDPNEMCGTFAPTSVISVSYGGPEYLSSAAVLQRQCNEFMKLGLQGISVVFASGDDGVANPSGYCLGPHHDIFVPDDASGCPYVTSVGSTMLPPGAKVGDPEVATTRFSSGGGFSNVFDKPSWQSNAVGNYLLRHNPNYLAYITTGGVIPENKGVYNRNGRAYPDISAAGDNGVVVLGGKVGLIGGTSMSAPIVAAIFNRINEERLNVGKGPIGFANPALYAASDQKLNLFNDVTVGDQSLGGAFGSRYPSACGNSGFSAVKGWDPVTGLGTPKYQAMLSYFLAL
ncbi:uncharacterized protein UV8b_04678 [Ustilaginoidea virens]|uniref:tripeptidyl-peptidase II n=1 Tax=Ustilaginoidea virens TaxID=1159556 RepID=A0A8E5MIC7_USTVR|nr:uncharacterized protein UV8b_04678 [Ustilaginoidea virens]QUC20437.1 hypothetical protein UV8b_04678 [Ustilaginoidea virens]